MNVGLISDAINNENITGIGNYTYNLFKKLLEVNTHGRYFVINYQDMKIFDRDTLIVENPFKQILQTYMWYPYLIIRLRKTDLDLIHNPSQIPTFFDTKQIYIITVHDLTPIIFPKEHKSGKSLIYKLLFPRTLKTADKIIAVSYSTKQDLLKYFKVADKQIKVIHEAADEKFQPLDKETIQKFKTKYNLNSPFILYVGTLEPRKNIPTLIKAFYNLRKYNLPHKLVITGKKGWKYNSIFEIIEKFDIQGDVIFTGYMPDEDLPALYNAADLFVYPSLYEGFGLPPLEAMSSGCPVITSNTSSLPEVVGDAGIMIDPYDVDTLTSSIYKVLTNDGLKADMVEKGLERAKMFSWEKTAKETLKIYREIYNKA